MSIVKMKKLRLVAMRSQQEELLRELMLLGCVEFSEPDDLMTGTEAEGLLKRRAGGTMVLRTQRREIEGALKVLDKYAPAKTKLLSPRPETHMESVVEDGDTQEQLELAEKINSLEDKIKSFQASESRWKGIEQSLLPWERLDTPLDIKDTEYCAVVFGTAPAAAAMGELESALALAVEEAQLFEVSSDREAHYIELVCLGQKRSEALKALRERGFSIASFPASDGTAKQCIEQARSEQKSARLNEKRLIDAVKKLSAHRRGLRLCWDRLGTKLARAEAADRLCETDSAFCMVGWTTAPEEDKLTALLGRYDCAWELTDPDPEEYGDVPIVLKSNRLTRPMNMVTEMYSLPAYNGVDPNPLIMPFFTMFFGIMYADMGYGLILLIIGLLVKRKMRPHGTADYIAGLLVMCGITTFAFGALTGGFFGDAIKTVMGMYGKSFTMPCLIDPVADPMTILIAALVIGAVQILTGMAINAYMLIREGKWFDALCDVGSWWLLFAGVALGALGVTWYVCFAGLAALVLTQGRDKPTVIGKLTSGIASLYDITGYFGDILSYSRLMALMLAGTVIASVVNTLGTLPGSIIAFALIFIVGHAFNMGINIIGTFVHAARLQYLEYFGKFYRDGGKPFRPLAVETKYYDIKD